jgi:dihydrofolate reductase
MPRLLVDFITSLDGFGAAKDWPGFWGIDSPEYLRWMDAAPERDDIVLMGATTYRMFNDFAANSDDVSLAELTRPRTVVFSSTLSAPLEWPNAELVATDPVEAVRAMKRDGTADLRTIGSLSLCRSLLLAGLVDRYRVVLFPVVTGATGHDRIYDGWPDVMLEPVHSRSFEGGLQLLEYVPTLLDGPPAR